MGNTIFSNVKVEYGENTAPPLKPQRYIVTGLEGAGKTTIFHQMRLGEMVSTAPIGGFNVETVIMKNMTFTIWNCGQDEFRDYAKSNYYKNTDAIIFVVDSTDRDYIDAARDELHRLLNEEELKASHLLVFANKKDLPNAMSEAEVKDKLGLNGLDRKWFMEYVCGVDEAHNYQLMTGVDALCKSLP